VAERVYNKSMRLNEVELEDLRRRLSEAEGSYAESKELMEKAEDRFEIKEHTYK
jgi:hypothetical protein